MFRFYTTPKSFYSADLNFLVVQVMCPKINFAFFDTYLAVECFEKASFLPVSEIA